MIAAASRLNIPLLITELCSDQIGHTLDDVLEAAGDGKVADKVHFHAQSEPGFTAALRRLDRGKPIICGMEVPVCVLQTALGLNYYHVVSADAVASRNSGDYVTALGKFASPVAK